MLRGLVADISIGIGSGGGSTIITDVNNTTNSSTDNFNNGEGLGQGWQAGSNYNLTTAEFLINNLGGTQAGNLTCQIRTTSGTIPSSTVLATSDNLALTSLPVGGLNPATFNFSTPLSITSGTIYHATVVLSGLTLGNGLNWSRSNGNIIPATDLSTTVDSGATWTETAISGRDWSLTIKGIT